MCFQETQINYVTYFLRFLLLWPLEGRIYLAYIPWLTVHWKKPRQELSAGSWRQALHQKPWRSVAYSFASPSILSLLSCTCQDPMPVDAISHINQQSKNFPTDFFHSPIWWIQFHWHLLFLDGCSFCQVDEILASIMCEYLHLYFSGKLASTFFYFILMLVSYALPHAQWWW